MPTKRLSNSPTIVCNVGVGSLEPFAEKFGGGSLGRTRQTVELGNHDDIAGEQRLHELAELGTTIPVLAALLLAEDALAARRLQNADLGGIVLCRVRHSRVAVFHASLPQWVLRVSRQQRRSSAPARSTRDEPSCQRHSSRQFRMDNPDRSQFS